MLKHHEPFDTHDVKIRHPETHELPKLPDDVVIPDDLSQLPPERRGSRLVRWGWWTALLALVAGGSVYVVSRLSDDSPADVEAPAIDVPAYDLKQQAIDEAVTRVEQYPDVREYYVGLYQDRLEGDAPAIDVPAYDLKQQAIDDEVARVEQLPDVREYYVGLYQDRLDDQSG